MEPADGTADAVATRSEAEGGLAPAASSGLSAIIRLHLREPSYEAQSSSKRVGEFGRPFPPSFHDANLLPAKLCGDPLGLGEGHRVEFHVLGRAGIPQVNHHQIWDALVFAMEAEMAAVAAFI